MISDTILFFIISLVLIYAVESKLIPQLLIFSMLVYNLYTKVIVSFQPLDVIMMALPILYCLGHLVNSIEPQKDEN